MYMHAQTSQKHLPRMAIVLFAVLCMVWVSIYGVVITGGFSRAFWAGLTAYDTVASAK